MINIEKDLIDFEFDKKAYITIKGELKHPVFNIGNLKDKTKGILYMWIEEVDNKPVKVLYIGKANKTLLKRCG